MKKQLILIVSLAFVSILLAFFYPKFGIINAIPDEDTAAQLAQDAIIPQKVIETFSEEQSIYTVYYKDRQLGIITDQSKLDSFLNQVYEERYKDEFPDSKVGFGEDIHVTESYSLSKVEDKDDEIIAYIDENDLFSIMGYKVEFSNGSVVYVQDPTEFSKAREEFVLNFLENEGVDPADTYWKLNNFQKQTVYSAKNARDISYRFEETAEITEKFVPIEKLLKSYDEYLTWLYYGYDYEPSYTTVNEYDTVQFIALQAGISSRSLIALNPDLLKSETQVLQAGMQLNVSKVNSPINVEVVKEVMREEIAFPGETEYIYDPTLREGITQTDQEYKEGKKNVLRRVTEVNGVETEVEIISELITEYPDHAIVRIGTMVIPSIGSGSFRWPVDNPTVTCGWNCYYGHTAIDIQNMYDHYGNVYAADRGVVEENSYNGINGNYMVINHNNGYRTYYGHMNVPGFWPVGTVVDKGEIIGQIGQTGLAFGPHVHFEVRTGGYGTSLYTCQFLGC